MRLSFADVPATTSRLKGRYDGGIVAAKRRRSRSAGGHRPLSHSRLLAAPSLFFFRGPLAMSQFWSSALVAWLHDPPDKTLSIVDHVSRARRYASAALGDAVTESDIKILSDSLASASERLPMPEGRGDDASDRRVGAEALMVIHPLSAAARRIAALPIDEDPIDGLREPHGRHDRHVANGATTRRSGRSPRPPVPPFRRNPPRSSSKARRAAVGKERLAPAEQSEMK